MEEKLCPKYAIKVQVQLIRR